MMERVQDGRPAGEILAVDEVLARLTRTTYTRSELQQDPLPEGVDPTRLESYLNDKDFQVHIFVSLVTFPMRTISFPRLK